MLDDSHQRRQFLMTPNIVQAPCPQKVMCFGVGAFTQGILKVLKESGATVSTYLTRDYGHYPPSLEGPCHSHREFPNPCQLLETNPVDVIIPQSIDWAQKPWAKELIDKGHPIFCPTGLGLKLERDRDFAQHVCRRFEIPFPVSHVARNRLEAEDLLRRDPRPYVIKNPLCSPNSPVHTIVCETVEDTRAWLDRIDYAEGVFLQEYCGRAEAGHIAVVSDGQIHSLVTNQEYKRAFDGDMGIVAGAPLGGIVQRDPEDQFGIAQELLTPLLPWFREVGFHGPVQVTAIRSENRWKVLEYNVRIGVTSGPMILKMLEEPVEMLCAVARNERLKLRFRREREFGCSITLAGYGYPYVQLQGPELPIEVMGQPDCDIYFNEVEPDLHGNLRLTGHRIADVVALESTLEGAIQTCYRNISRLRCVGSYYRTDVGKSLWPPLPGRNSQTQIPSPQIKTP